MFTAYKESKSSTSLEAYSNDCDSETDKKFWEDQYQENNVENVDHIEQMFNDNSWIQVSPKPEEPTVAFATSTSDGGVKSGFMKLANLLVLNQQNKLGLVDQPQVQDYQERDWNSGDPSMTLTGA